MEVVPLQDVYGDHDRATVAPFVPRAALSALDVGCARGGFGRTLRHRLGPAARIIGVEPVHSQAELARETGAFDNVHEGFFPAALPAGDRFDVVCFLDVLEHMIDPWSALVDAKGVLVDGGRVVASIPSIEYYEVMWQVGARGRWDYTDQGTLDRTHLRFFTRATMIEMFTQCGYVVETCSGIGGLAARWSTDPFALRRWLKTRVTDAVLGRRQFLQFVIVARPVAER